MSKESLRNLFVEPTGPEVSLNMFEVAQNFLRHLYIEVFSGKQLEVAKLIISYILLSRVFSDPRFMPSQTWNKES